MNPLKKPTARSLPGRASAREAQGTSGNDTKPLTERPATNMTTLATSTKADKSVRSIENAAPNAPAAHPTSV